MRERIFKAIGGIPAESLYNYIKQGIVTYQELLEHGLDKFPEKKAYVESKLSAGEQSAWKDAEQMNTVEGYDKYLSLFALILKSFRFLHPEKGAFPNLLSEAGKLICSSPTQSLNA